MNQHLRIGFYLSLIAALMSVGASVYAQGSTSDDDDDDQKVVQSTERTERSDDGVKQMADPFNNNPLTSGGAVFDANPVNSLNGLGNSNETRIPFVAPRKRYADIYGEKEPEKGWKALAAFLDTITPSVDTRVPPSPTDLTVRYQYLLDQQRYAEALKEIEERLETEKGRKTPGTDVQLTFLHARALALNGRLDEAEQVYQNMTVQFPELAEPWNNLATLYVKSGHLDQARRALEMALLIDPAYGVAQANLGDINLLLAVRAYEVAASSNVQGVKQKMRIVELIANPRLKGARQLNLDKLRADKAIGIRSAIDIFMKRNYISERF